MSESVLSPQIPQGQSNNGDSCKLAPAAKAQVSFERLNLLCPLSLSLLDFTQWRNFTKKTNQAQSTNRTEPKHGSLSWQAKSPPDNQPAIFSSRPYGKAPQRQTSCLRGRGPSSADRFSKLHRSNKPLPFMATELNLC